MLVTMNDAAAQFFTVCNEYGRLFPRQLADATLAEAVLIERADRFVGFRDFDTLLFTFTKDADAFVILIHTADIDSRHPQTHDPLFRGERWLAELAIPLARAKGWVD